MVGLWFGLGFALHAHSKEQALLAHSARPAHIALHVHRSLHALIADSVLHAHNALDALLAHSAMLAQVQCTHCLHG